MQQSFTLTQARQAIEECLALNDEAMPEVDALSRYTLRRCEPDLRGWLRAIDVEEASPIGCKGMFHFDWLGPSLAETLRDCDRAREVGRAFAPQKAA